MPLLLLALFDFGQVWDIEAATACTDRAVSGHWQLAAWTLYWNGTPQARTQSAFLVSMSMPAIVQSVRPVGQSSELKITSPRPTMMATARSAWKKEFRRCEVRPLSIAERGVILSQQTGPFESGVFRYAFLAGRGAKSHEGEQNGIEAGAALFRTLPCGMMSALFVLTTDPGQLVRALMINFRLPASVGLALMQAMHLVPNLGRELTTLRMARAMHHDRPLRRFPGPMEMTTLAIPLPAFAIRRATRSAIAM